MRSILLFVGIAVLSAALMIAGVLLALPVGFATQGGQGWRAAPLQSAVVWLAEGLLAPLSWLGAFRGVPPLGEWGFGGILMLSVAYGLLAVAVRWAWRARHQRRSEHPG